MDRYILGVHSGHDASACLLKNNEVVLAIEKERLTRKKHDAGEPIECIEYIMDAEKIDYRNIDLIVRSNWFDSSSLDNDYYKRFRRVIERYEHHLLHAYAVSLMCKENNSLIYIIDGRGCRPVDNGDSPYTSNLYEAESLYWFNNYLLKDIKTEKRYSRHFSNQHKWGSSMDSVGYAYGALSKIMFGNYDSAGKIMALAAFGKTNPNIPKALLYDEKRMRINPKWYELLESLPMPLPYSTDIAKDISYALQREIEIYLHKRFQQFIIKFNCYNFAYGGGVALNCKNNGKLINSLPLKALNIFPACGDNGLSVGAAIYGLREIFHDLQELSWNYGLGRKYEMLSYHEEELLKVIRLLYEDKIVGIYENGSEFGPRALCNRSIIASAKNIAIKDRLNIKIKERESFRPFGGVILEKNLYKITNERLASDLMLSAVNILPQMVEKMPALVHKDQTVRLQIIKENQQNTSIYNILKRMEEVFGEIILINTSFNGKNEPIVETVDEARSTAKKIGLDFLLINGTLERV